MIVRCLNDNDYEDLKLYVDRVARVMIDFEWLINAKLINFYVDSSWSKLPDAWQDYLSELSAAHLAQLLAGEQVTVRKVMPLSLQCFRQVARQLSFARQESNLGELNRLVESLSERSSADRKEAAGTNKLEASNQSSRRTTENRTGEQYKITELDRIDLKDVFTRNLKIKKQHEVGRFSSLIRNVLDPNGVQLVDFGSGRGHLSRFLSLYFKYQVTTLELQASTSRRAAELDLQASKNCETHSRKQAKPWQAGNLPKHLNVKVNSDLELNLEDSSAAKVAAIGLHACGTLSRHIIELFKGGLADYLFLVSCCYHLDGAEDGKSFPLSKAANSSLTNFRNFNHETKEIACHSIETSIEQLKGDYSKSKMKIHCYRALLEDIFERYSPDFRMTDLAKVRHVERLDFVSYARSAIRKLPLQLDDAQLNDELTRRRLDNQLEVIRFYFVRLMLGPMIEHLIQVDRMLFLYENGLGSALCSLFEPKLSPRNAVLCSFRSNTATN